MGSQPRTETLDPKFSANSVVYGVTVQKPDLSQTPNILGTFTSASPRTALQGHVNSSFVAQIYI